MASANASSLAPVPVERRRALIVEPVTKRSWAWVWVALMTMAAAVLRFWSLDQPAIWGDEAAVYWRTCGTFAQLLEILKNDGFAPLHYEFYWVLQQFFTMTPQVMRFVPALSAVLMVPTMYWLAKQLVGTRVALVVATFTAVCAHLGWHAHDAKMYSHFWLLCALNMACFIWWLRKGGGIAWWCWVASGVAMVGLLFTGFVIVALQPLMLILSPRRKWHAYAAYVLGLALIGIGPAIYYLHYNQWAQNIETRGWEASGIAWVQAIMGRTTPMDQVRTTVSHLLFGYEFPAPWLQELGYPKWRLTQDVPVWLGIALLAALFPWPTRDRGRGVSSLPQPWWRTTLFVGAWVLLPAYAFYCASFAGYAWPSEMLKTIAQAVTGSAASIFWSIALLLAGTYCLAPTNRARLTKTLQGLAICAVILLLLTCIAWAFSIRPPGPVWVTRYITFVWPAFVIGTFALLLRLPWPARWIAVSVLILASLAQSIARVNSRQDPPLDLLTADILEARQPGSGVQTHFLVRSMVTTMQPIEHRYYLFMTSGEKATPEEFRTGDLRTRFGLSTRSTPQTIARALKDVPSVRRLFIWEQVPGPTPQRPERTYPEKMKGNLPQGWEKVGEQVFAFSSRWAWAASNAWRRCEYRLVEPPATQP